MIPRSKFAIVFILFIAVLLFINLHSDISVPMNKPFNEFPARHRGWEMVLQTFFRDQVLSILKPTDYLYRQYMTEERIPVDLYIGYHGGGKDSGEIHSPKHCIVAEGWYKSYEEKMIVDAGNRKINLVKAIYQKGEGKEVFFYWYQMKGKSLSDDYLLKIAQIINSILYRRRDSAFIRISVPFTSDEKRASMIGMRFVKDFYPVIDDFLPK